MTMDAVVIGAGPAGLAAATVLNKHGIKLKIIEQTNQCGGTYAKLQYPLKLLSPNPFNQMPYAHGALPWRRISAQAYQHYLSDYARQCALPIEYHCRALKISREDNKYVTQTDKGVLQSSYVILASGISGFPKALPQSVVTRYAAVEMIDAMAWKGIDSSRGKKVLVVGSGTTALEIAAQLAGHADVYLANRHPIRAIPLYVFGLNFHYGVRWLELLPKSWFPAVCSGRWREPAIGRQIIPLLHKKLITRVLWRDPPGEYRTQANQPIQLDLIINCTGYHYDESLCPDSIAKLNGYLQLSDCESVSHPGFFVMGYPCGGGIDSKYLRGIRRDAFRISNCLINKRKTT